MSGTIAGGSYHFPDINVPSSQKDAEWHKKFVWAIAHRAIDSAYDLDYRIVEQCQDYYNGVQDNSAFSFIQENVDGDKLPAFWVNYNRAKTKVDLILGEYSAKSYTVNVSSVNRDAKIRKLEAKQNAKVDFRLSPYAAGLEQKYGIPLQQGQQFSDEEEIDEFYEYSYKEKSEVIVKSALQYCLQRQRWDYERHALMRDMLISGRSFAKCELINGIPKSRRIDPKFMIWDKEATDDFLTDATYFGEVRYMNIAEAAQKYDLTIDELKKSYNSQRFVHNTSNPKKYREISGVIQDSSLSFFKTDRGELRVLVLEAYWVDTEKLTNKISEDKYGGVHVKTMSDETKIKKNVQSNRYKVWRKGVLVGGEFIKDWGVIKNMPRSVDDPTDTGCPYKACVPNYVNYANQSIVSLIKPLQDLKNISLYNVQLAMARAGAKGFIYDTAQIPDGWDVHDVISYLKSTGIAFINSLQNDGLPVGFNQFQTVDLSLGQEINRYLEVALMCDREMDQITGINEARQGIVQSASQAVGVTESALLQSSLTTQTYLDSMRMLSSDIFSYMAGLLKVSWPQYGDRFSYIIGDEGLDFLVEDVDLDLDDYAVIVEEVPPSIANEQNVQTMVNTAIQSQQIDIIQGAKILKHSKDVDKAIRMLEREKLKADRKAEQIREQEAQQQQMQIQAQAQMQQQEQQADFQKDVYLKKMDNETAMSQAKLDAKIRLIMEQVRRNTELEKKPYNTGQN